MSFKEVKVFGVFMFCLFIGFISCLIVLSKLFILDIFYFCITFVYFLFENYASFLSLARSLYIGVSGNVFGFFVFYFWELLLII